MILLLFLTLLERCVGHDLLVLRVLADTALRLLFVTQETGGVFVLVNT